jgi:hypothetical protein
LATYSRLIHTSNYSRKRPTNQTTISFVDEQDYERPHAKNGILDIKGQHQPNELYQKVQGEISSQLCMGQTF